MDLGIFVTVSTIHLSLIALNLRIWGIASCEGLLMAYYGAAALSDNVALLAHYFIDPDELIAGYGEFGMRIFPTLISIAATVILMTGLYAANPHRAKVRRRLNDQELDLLSEIGLAIFLVGIALFIIGVGLVGFTHFYRTLDDFRVHAMPYGGFWYRGSDLAVFGLALVFASSCRSHHISAFSIVVMISIVFFLTSNKGGLEKAILWSAFALYIYQADQFARLFTFKRVLIATLVIYVGVGLKIVMEESLLHGTNARMFSAQRVLRSSSAGVATRFSDQGDYRSFCQFIDELDEYHLRFEGYKAGVYTVTGWLPRVLYPDRPEHPFELIGEMTDPYFANHSVTEKAAPGWVGEAMADGGYFTLTVYTLLAGVFLGLFRSLATRSGSLPVHLCYVLYALLGGVSYEAGSLSAFDALVLAVSTIVTARTGVAVIHMVARRTLCWTAPSG
jgi:hypothetical protein